MELLARVIADLDVPPQARANVKVITLEEPTPATRRKSFSRSSWHHSGAPRQRAAAARAARPEIAPSPAAPGFPRAVFHARPTTADWGAGIPLSLAVNTRTNSLILAGSPSDID